MVAVGSPLSSTPLLQLLLRLPRGRRRRLGRRRLGLVLNAPADRGHDEAAFGGATVGRDVAGDEVLVAVFSRVLWSLICLWMSEWYVLHFKEKPCFAWSENQTITSLA